MIVRHSKTPLPRCFVNHPAGGDIVGEADIRIRGRGTMAAKLVVLPNPAKLRKFWTAALGTHLGKGCLGAVNPLVHQRDEGGPVTVDPTYFCLIGLQLQNLSMEVITHESVHAGFAYANRHRKNFWVLQSDNYDEEDTAYPAGKVARGINSFLHDKGLYK